MAPEVRNEPVSLRLSRDELHMLKAMAEAKGVSQSDVLRMLLREAWTAQHGKKAPPKPK
jgi:uncharacterized protein (DUF1778 family)